jgi:hypothetical protein
LLLVVGPGFQARLLTYAPSILDSTWQARWRTHSRTILFAKFTGFRCLQWREVPDAQTQAYLVYAHQDLSFLNLDTMLGKARPLIKIGGELQHRRKVKHIGRSDLPIVQTSAKLYGERTVPTAKHVHCAKDVNRLREPV